jgi:hypothetical protein
MRATLYSYERDTLEAIDRHGELRPYELSDQSGWPAASCAAAQGRLRRLGLLYRAGDSLRLTDAGKIVLAITRGKEHRARLLRRKPAA